LDYVREFVCCRLFFFEAGVALEIESNPSTILFNNSDQCRLVDVDPSLVWLRRLVDVHVLEHSFDAKSHPIVIHAGSSGAGLSVSGDYGDTLNSF
jgi:hypothetical protein